MSIKNNTEEKCNCDFCVEGMPEHCNEQVDYTYIVCPYCGHEHDDALEICSPDDYDGVTFQCSDCEKDIKVFCEVTLEWTARKVK